MTTNIKVVEFPGNYFDSFGRQRVSEPFTLFDSKLLNNPQPLFWDDQQTSGSGTASVHSVATASVSMSVSASTAGTRVRQTYRRIAYQPGKGQLFFLTGVLGPSLVGVRTKIGQFDGTNGVYFQQSPTGLEIVRISNSGAFGSPETIPQASWNLDTMNGAGGASNPSGINLDPTKTQVFVIDYEWLGVGIQLLGVVIDRKIYYVHKFNNANVNTVVYMGNPNLPIRYEITADGTNTVSASLMHICSTAISEGGKQISGITRSADVGVTPLTTLNNTNQYPLVMIRLAAGQINAQVVIEYGSVSCSSASTYRVSLVLNPTIVGTAPVFNPIANSAVEFATPTNATTVTGGTQLLSNYVFATTGSGDFSAPIEGDFRMGASIAGISDVVALVVQRATGTTETFYGSLGWREST